MRPANLFYFYRRRLRHRLVQELLALAGIAVGVALLFAVEVSNQSLSQSVAQSTAGLIGGARLQIIARDSHGFGESVVRAVEGLPDVRVAAPVFEADANLVGPRGSTSVRLIACDMRMVRLGGRLLRGYRSAALARSHAILLPEGAARAVGAHFGGLVDVQVHGRSTTVPVGNVATETDVGSLARSPLAVVPLSYGQRLSGMPGRVTRVYVIPVAGREGDVEHELERIAHGRLDVRPADFDRQVFNRAAMPNDRSTSLFAGISALVGFLFAFNALLLVAREQRCVIVDLRMAGYGMAAVFEVLLFDAAVLGLTASVAGIALGDQLSRHLFDPAPGYLAYAFPVGSARTVTTQALLIAVASGVVASVLAAIVPLATMFSQRPVDAIDDDRLAPTANGLKGSRWMLVGAGLCLAVTLLIVIEAPGTAMTGMVMLIVAMLMSLPATLTALLRLANRLRRRIRSVVPMIAVGELRSAGPRSVGLAAIAALAVLGSTAIEGAHGDLKRGLDAASRDEAASADLWVWPRGTSNHLSTVPFAASSERALAGISGVRAVRPYRGSFLDVGDNRAWVLAPSPNAPAIVPSSQVVAGNLDLANDRLRAGGWAILSESLAAGRGLSVGDRFVLESPRPKHLRLAAITTNLGWPGGAVILNADDYRQAFASADVSALLLDVDGPLSLTERAVRDALGSGSALRVETSVERRNRFMASTREGLARLTQIATLVLISAGLAIAAAMAGMIWQRRRRLAELKLVGLGPERLWRALLVETALVLGIGCAAGGAFGLVGQRLLDRALSTVTGFPVVESLGFSVVLLSVGLVAIIAFVMAALPGYLAARVPTALAFQD